MSVLTEKKRKKKGFKFLGPVAAVAACKGNVYKLYDINCSTQPQQHKACKEELSVSFIISKKVPLETEE